MVMNGIPIYYGDTPVGALSRTEEEAYCLDYDAEWQQKGFPVSQLLPVDEAHHEGAKVEYYVENLLPEGELRKALSTKFGISNNNYYDLVLAIGKDCAGAFSIGVPQSSGDYVPLTLDELQRELQHLRAYHLPGEQEGRSYSLAGAQDKEVLFEEKGVFHLPLHGAASNCIVKTPGRHKGSVENELFCMKLAKAVGLEVSEVEYLALPDIPSLKITRYDRKGKGRAITRVPQEDFCQLSALPSSRKYEKEGGPSFADCAKLIRRYSNVPARDLLRLVDWAGFNMAIGNMDAHAKNLSLFLDNDGVKRLAPFYDLISTRFYPPEIVNGDLAMRIGGRFNPERVGSRQWKAFAEEIGFSPDLVAKRLRALWVRIIAALPDTLQETQGITASAEILPELKKQILQRTMGLNRDL